MNNTQSKVGHTPGNSEALSYIRAIRNEDKRHYAGLYWQFINGNTYKPDDRALSYMAAQAVRLSLLAIQDKAKGEA